MAHAEVQSLGVYKFVLNWLSIMWLKKVRYQPETDPHSHACGLAVRRLTSPRSGVLPLPATTSPGATPPAPP